MYSDAIRYDYDSTYSDAIQVVLADHALRHDDFLAHIETNGFSRADIYQKLVATYLALSQINKCLHIVCVYIRFAYAQVNLLGNPIFA